MTIPAAGLWMAIFERVGAGQRPDVENAHPHPGHPDVVVPVRLDPAGRTGPTPGQARGPRWRRSSHGLVVPADVRLNLEQRIVEAAARLPAYGGVTGWAALRWATGSAYFDGRGRDGLQRPVTLAVMHGEISAQPGMQITSERLPPRDLTTFDGLPITTHPRSVGFEMRYAESLWSAVVALDMAAFHDLVSLEEMAEYVLTLNGWIGVPQCRAALALADENSWSPMETRMRMYWTQVCGFPPPMCNRPVFDLSGNHIGTPDILDVDAGVVGEYDGHVHREDDRRGKDLRRSDAFRRAGLECFTMVGADQSSPLTSIVPRMEETRQRARFEAPGSRGWTIEPPPGWTLTTTVAARRSLTERQRTRLLRNRAG